VYVWVAFVHISGFVHYEHHDHRSLFVAMFESASTILIPSDSYLSLSDDNVWEYLVFTDSFFNVPFCYSFYIYYDSFLSSIVH
jgi:hypothetical protein